MHAKTLRRMLSVLAAVLLSISLSSPAQADSALAPLYEVRSLASGECVNGSITDAEVWMHPCGLGNAEWEFRFPGGQSTYFWLYHPLTNRCLSLKGVESGTPRNGYDAQMEPCEWTGADNGRGDDSVWYYSGSGSVNYRSRVGGLCLEYDTADIVPPETVQVWQCVGQSNARWRKVAV
jgi:hypothetical protein